MNTMRKVTGLMAGIMVASSMSIAAPSHSGHDYRGPGGRYGQSTYRPGGHPYGYHSNRGGRHCYPHYAHRHSENWAYGLLGLSLVAAVASSASQPDTVYVHRSVVIPPLQPPAVYIQPARVEYVQPTVVEQQTVVVQSPVAYAPPTPVSMTMNVQNSNGSMTPVILRQIGNQWIGPKGEYYDNLPSIGQLRPVYGF